MQLHELCDVYQGYDFKPEKHTTFGYITDMMIGPNRLLADQGPNGSPGAGGEAVFVAVLTEVLWEMTTQDTLFLSGQISAANQKTLLGIIVSPVSMIVTFQTIIYEYDVLSKKYFNVFHSGGQETNGITLRKGDGNNITVASDPSLQVQSPVNYAFSIGIKPQAGADGR